MDFRDLSNPAREDTSSAGVETLKATLETASATGR